MNFTDRTPLKIDCTIVITPEMVENHRKYEANESIVTHKSFHPLCGFYTFTGTKAEYQADRAALEEQRKWYR